MVLEVSDGIVDILLARQQNIICEVMYLACLTSWLLWQNVSLLYDVRVGDVCLVITLRSNVIILDKEDVLL